VVAAVVLVVEHALEDAPVVVVLVVELHLADHQVVLNAVLVAEHVVEAVVVHADHLAVLLLHHVVYHHVVADVVDALDAAVHVLAKVAVAIAIVYNHVEFHVA
jgi:hypothetical protein